MKTEVLRIVGNIGRRIVEQNNDDPSWWGFYDEDIPQNVQKLLNDEKKKNQNR